MTDLQQDVEQQGFTVLSGLFGSEWVAGLASQLESARLEMKTA
jgi:hypothetical protein